MFYLFGTVVTTAYLFLLFKWFGKNNIPVLPIIIINYGICAFTGSIINLPNIVVQQSSLQLEGIIGALVLGSIFLPSFFLLGNTTVKIGVGPTTIANKLSMILPSLFSLFYFGHQVSVYYPFIFILAALSIYLVSPQPDQNLSAGNWYLPLIIFSVGGFIDVLLLLCNTNYIHPEQTSRFTILLFFSAFTNGVLYWTISGQWKKMDFSSKWLLYGALLGIPNYFSVYFLLKTLAEFENNGAIVFPILNLSIILISTGLSKIIFKEVITKRMFWGLISSLVCLVLLTLT
jgi:drug/metabolite transporter (DMT)-like permease